MNQSTDHLNDQVMHQQMLKSSNASTARSIDRSNNKPINQTTDKSNHRSTNQPTIRSITSLQLPCRVAAGHPPQQLPCCKPMTTYACKHARMHACAHAHNNVHVNLQKLRKVTKCKMITVSLFQLAAVHGEDAA